VRHFVEELEQLKSKLLEMSSLVESAIYRSITAVVQKDEALANEVLKNEGRINQIESTSTNSPLVCSLSNSPWRPI
jgi:phosphate transport system protein